jgi:hypothetical protein
MLYIVPGSRGDDNAQAVSLARDLLAALPRAAADSFTVIFGDPAAAEAAGSSGGLSNPVVAVDPSAGSQLAGPPLLIVGATQQQVTRSPVLTASETAERPLASCFNSCFLHLSSVLNALCGATALLYPGHYGA